MKIGNKQPLFEVKKVDVDFYQERLKGFLPDKIIDIHTHVWLDQLRSHSSNVSSRGAKWPALVAKDNSIEDLIQTYELLFPDKKVTPMIFSWVKEGDSFDKLNAYVSECVRKHGILSLAFTTPDWSAEKFERVVIEGGFLGVKVYLRFSPSYIPANEIRIFDFLPSHQLKVLDRNGWIVMLHIPRPWRLKDPVNIAQLQEVERCYPNLKLIVAHVGRAYCIEDVGNALDILSKTTKKMLFDFSANTNEEVFKQLIKTIGPKRVLFGSDMPITRMRMRRVCENGIYVNLVSKGEYGDLSNEKHMREVNDTEAEKLTFFLYEQIEAFRRAALATKLTSNDIKDVFYNNAKRVVGSVKV